MSKPEKLVEVYRAANDMEAQIIKSLLESYNIPCVLKSNALPTALMGAFDMSSPVKVMCLESMAERAQELVRGEGAEADAESEENDA